MTPILFVDVSADRNCLDYRACFADMQCLSCDQGEKQKELQSKQQEWLAEELEARKARGQDCGVMGNMAAVKEITFRMKREIEAHARELNQKHGNVYEKPAEVAMAEAGDAMQMIRPGDGAWQCQRRVIMRTVHSSLCWMPQKCPRSFESSSI